MCHVAIQELRQLAPTVRGAIRPGPQRDSKTNDSSHLQKVAVRALADVNRNVHGKSAPDETFPDQKLEFSWKYWKSTFNRAR
jgi:hypothetical protein